MKTRLSVALSLFLLFGVAVGVGVSASDEYGITPRQSSSVDIPSYAVTYNGTEYTAERLSVVDPGESLTVDTQGPADTAYIVYLVDKQERVRRSDSASGAASSTFDTDRLDAGTYAVTIQNDTTRALHPVVIQGYDVTLSYRDSVAPGTELDVTAVLSETDSDVGSPSRVTVTVWNDSVTRETTATRVNETFYRAQVPTKTLSKDTYSLLVAVEGSEQVAGQNELLAVSETSTVTVAEQTTPTVTPTPMTTPTSTPTTSEGSSDTGGKSSDGPTGGDGSSVTTSTATPTPPTSQPTLEPTEPDGTPQITASTGREPATDTPAQPSTDTPVSMATETSDDQDTATGTATPEATEEPSPESTGRSGPGFGVTAAVVAALAAAVIAMRRRP